mgnify:CR=1 FL=1
MRALLTPEVAPMTGVVIFRPGSELMHLFRRGRVLIEPQAESMAELPSGLLPETAQELQNDPSMRDVFENQKVIHRAGGLNSLDAWLENWNVSTRTASGMIATTPSPGMRLAQFARVGAAT